VTLGEEAWGKVVAGAFTITGILLFILRIIGIDPRIMSSAIAGIITLRRSFIQLPKRFVLSSSLLIA
jgi:hypothetical protein